MTSEETTETGAAVAAENETTEQNSSAGEPGAGSGEAGAAHQHAQASLNPECTREVEIEVPAEAVTKSFREVTKRYQKLARIPGFRPGKVPESVLRSRFAGAIREEVVEAVVPPHFREAIAQKGLRPVSQPQVTDLNLEEGHPLRFKAVFEVVPEFSVDGYQEVRVEKPDSELSDAEYQAEVERIRDARATMEDVTEDRGLMDGDWAQITFTGVLEGEEEGENQPAQPIEGQDVSVEIGGPDTVQAFTDALRGSKAGQELKFEVTYPGDFGQKRLAGKTVAYAVEVRGIRKKVKPELNDAFAKEMGKYDNLEDFEKQLRDHLASDKKHRILAETRNRLVDALVTKFSFAVPESMVQSQVDTRLERGLRALAAQGMRTEDMRKLDFDRLREAQRESAASEVKGALVLDRIADVENIQVSDEETERELQVISLQTREPIESLRDRLTREGGLARIREQLRREKTGNMLVERLA
ncbi:MAG TPA: trigger factor [Acidobacteriaceae bacterium]|nr:trigger factor [Acidobacteriaceae bacterium]